MVGRQTASANSRWHRAQPPDRHSIARPYHPAT